MRLPLSWLADYVDPELPAAELATRLAMTGTEVDRVHHHGVGALEHFVVGHVLEAAKHPDADRLTVCRVDVGEDEPAQIVCGAPNVAAGQTVAVARPGAVMPDGTKLRTAKLRGVASAGMILAEDELAIGSDHAGIMVLGEGLKPGTPLAEVLPIATDVLELEITPNRPDCLGVYGVAREVHAATGAALAPPPWAGVDLGPATGIDGVEIEVRDADVCPRFTVLAYENVKIAPSPPWLKARLMAAGQRPINNVVDITNYVMLLTGQPLHAFDLDRVQDGRLTVRRVGPALEMTTLDGQTRSLSGDMLVIEDGQGPTSIAGVMGGSRSEVSQATTRVLMEVACWDGPNVHATSGALGLRSEASARNEKGLSPEQTVEAQIVARELMVSCCDARPIEGWIDVGGPGPADAVITTRASRTTALLGVDVAPEKQTAVLEALGFGVVVAAEGDGLDVAVPHWRRLDVTREADVIEEIARLAALEILPATLPARRGAHGRLSHAQRMRRRAEDVLAALGSNQIAGWSFASPGMLDRLLLPADSPMRQVVTLANPMSEDEAILRPTALGSLLDAARHNVARGRDRLALFESAAVYRRGEDGFDGTASSPGVAPAAEHHALALLLSGPLGPASWRGGEASKADFFAAKGMLAAVLDALRVDWDVAPAADWPFLTPGRSAEILVGGARAGLLGEVHPLVAQEWDLDQVAFFAVDLGKVVAASPDVAIYVDATSFPPVLQDLALVVDGAVPAGDVVAAVRAAGGGLLRRAEVFDRYDMGEGRVSLAVHLEFAAADRTLTDEEVAGSREKIVAALADRLGAAPRA